MNAVTVYSGRATNWLMLWLTIGTGVPLVVLGALSAGDPDQRPFFALLTAVVVVNLLTATSVRASAGPEGVIVRVGVLGWPRRAYPLHRIARAEAAEIGAFDPLAWGISWWPGQGLRFTMGRGPALRLTLTSGRRVTVSVPDPATAVATLDAARSTPPPR